MIDKKIRADFPIFQHQPELVYLDNAATTHKPYAVISALKTFYSTSYAPVYRAIYKSAERATEQYEQARSTIAQFIGAQENEIAFTKGTTESINLVAHALEHHFKPEDELVLTELDHHANILPWQQLAQRKKVTIRYIPVTQQGELELKNLDQIITPKTRLVAVTHLSNVTGIETDLEPIIKQVRKVGALILIDAAQSAPRKKIDTQELDTDFLVFSGHKLLGPTGIGVLYAHKNTHALLQPYQTGGGMVADVSLDYNETTFRPFPHGFEAGTPPVAGALGLAAAIDYLTNTIDFSSLTQHESSLCAQLMNGLLTIPDLRFIGDPKKLAASGHMASFIIGNWHPHDSAAFLDSQNIAVRAGHHCAQPLHKKLGLSGSLRASFYLYNTEQEVELLLTALRALKT